MKVAVIGSRSFDDYEELKRVLSKINITLLVSGGAKGADSLGERYADENNISKKIYLPNWEKFGKSAGMIRNDDIIKKADIVVAFWDQESKGTLNAINKAKRQNKKLIIINFNS